MQRFRNILVAVDSRWDKHPALQWAVRLAEHNQAKLKIVDVLPDLPWIAKVTVPDSEIGTAGPRRSETPGGRCDRTADPRARNRRDNQGAVRSDIILHHPRGDAIRS